MDNYLKFSYKIMPTSTSKFQNLPNTSPKELKRESTKRFPIFTKMQTISKSKLYKKNTGQNNLLSNKSIRRKSFAYYDNNNIEENNMKEIYKDHEDNIIPKLIQKFMEIEKCSILQYGLKPSTEEIVFSFCMTCDPNLINPICLECIKKCHFGHNVKKTNMIGKIKCICGERLHCMSKKPDLTINNASCQLAEWYITSKLNFYYETKDNKCLCMLCYNFCNHDKTKEKLIQLNSFKDNNIPNCCCQNEDVHLERKKFFEKMEIIANKIDIFDYFNLLHPSQIINMIFLSKNQFDFNYTDLNFLNNILLSINLPNSELLYFLKKANFASTNYYLIFKHLIEFIKWNKHTNISYYCKEAENYFSFEKAKIVFSLLNLMKYNEKSFWVLSSEFLLLFHKIYIGNLTQSFPKFKINDLENFPCSLRILLLNSNKKKFPESEDIINFLISILKKINISGFSSSEVMDSINIIIIIIKKMAIFNLLSNGDMLRIIHELEQIVSDLKSFRNIFFKSNQSKSLIEKKSDISQQKSFKKSPNILFEKEIKLFYNIMKLINIFIFSFNDRIINSALSNNNKYPTIDSIKKENIPFCFFKIELGRGLIRLIIRILYTIQNDYSKYSNEEKYKYLMNEGLKILSCFFNINDIYFFSLIQNLNKAEYYQKGIEMEYNKDNQYIIIEKENKRLEECYKKYFIFENDIENVIKEINNSLGLILEEKAFSEKKIICLLKSNYFLTLSKFYQILNFEEQKRMKYPKELQNLYILKDEKVTKAIDNIFFFYKKFIINSCENSLLLFSNYLFRNLCKSPIEYSIQNYELFLEALNIITSKLEIIANIKDYISNLFNYLQYLKNKSYSKIKECLLIFLKMIKMFILNIKCFNPHESINSIKSIIILIDKEYKIAKNFFSFYNTNSRINEEDQKNNYEDCILFYLIIINNIFDFTNIEDKNDVLQIIIPEEVIQVLNIYDIKLNLRTEFLKYIRKFYIDLAYDDNEKSNQIYTNSIISIEDNLALLKTNPFIANFGFPTKLLSFFKDFVNLSIHSENLLKNNNNEGKQKENLNQNYTFQFNQTRKIEEVESSNYNTNKDKDKNIDESDENEEDKEDNEKDDLIKEKSISKTNSDSNSSSSSNNSIKKKLKPCFDNTIYELLMNELLNLKKITENIKIDNFEEMMMLGNYFENGLLIPIIYFLKRAFSFSHCFTGKEMLKLYDLVFETCNLRLFIAEYKYDFWKESNCSNKNDEMQLFNINKISINQNENENFYPFYNHRSFLVNGSFCINNILNTQTKKAIDLLKTKKNLFFDFTSLYKIFEENILILLNERELNKYNNFLIKKENDISLKMIKKEEQKLFPDYKNINEIDKRFIRLYLIYKNFKNIISNENNSSLFSILPEICLEQETNYRHLLLNFLINNGKKEYSNIDNERKSLLYIYELLCLQTAETQNNLINLIGGIEVDENDLGFLTELGRDLFRKIILLFIDNFNPPDIILDTNYVISYLLISIFKLLCEEHNNFFQSRLIKSLKYKYIEITPIFCEDLQKLEDSFSKGESKNEIKNYNSKNIKIFDFFLHVLLKIMLISEWDKLDYINKKYYRQNGYLYDIFEIIIEMLNEIIQGNKPQYLNYLGNSFVDNIIEIQNLIDGANYYLSESNGLILKNENDKEEGNNLEKVDNFRYFVKNVTDFIFSNKASLELLYKIRNNLMEFFTTILEEKNCNEEVQKFIIKYLNINRVFNSISSILKSYYIRASTDEEEFNLLKIMKVDKNNENYINKQEYFKKHKNLSTKISLGNTYKLTNNLQTNINRLMKQKEKEIVFNEKLLEYYRNLYFTIKEFNQTYEFKLSNAFYKYIKLIIVLNKNEEAKKLIEETASLSEERAKKKFSFEEEKKPNTQNKSEIPTINKKGTSKNLNANLILNKKKFKKSSILNTNYLNNSEILDLKLKQSKVSDKTISLNNSLKSINYIMDTKKKRKLSFSLIKEKQNEYDKESIEHYYIIKFFESITKTIEVRTAGALNQTVIFTQPPEMIYLSNGTKSEFEREVNRDSETSKKNYLVRNVQYFQKEIKYYQRNHNNLSRWVSKIDFLNVQIASYIYALLFNLFILFTLNGDTKLSFEEAEKGSIKSRRANKQEIQSLIDKSQNEKDKIYNIICTIYIVLNAICIFIWIYFRMPLYYKLDRLKYIEEKNIQNNKNLKLYQKIYIILIMTIYDRDHILTLIYEFIFSLIGRIVNSGEIVYAFMLLPIIDINNILKNIIVSVKLQYNEVCLTFFFSAIVMYAFSNMAFFFFNDDFTQEIEYKNDNVCKSLIFCFLNTLDSGLRARGGIGDSAIRLSYKSNKKHYILRLILDDIFFLLIVIIAIDLVFGIIIGAFSTLRNEEQKHSSDRKNHCFICHVNKNTLERNRENFNEHRDKIHNLWNYVDYMITLKFSNIHDLNAINSYAIQKIEKKDISWLPTYKDLNNNKKNGEELEEELKVEEENINKYYIKNC